jgi:hypothetical protein
VRVAVLASGPSLPETWPAARAASWDAVIAVNVAATLYPCDWWVAGDGHAFDLFQPILPPFLGLVTDALTYQRTDWWHKVGAGLRVHRWCDFRAPFGSGQWHTSGPTAVGFAALRLGADEVHCFGMDLAGGFDLDGSPACLPTGIAHRWEVEAAELVAIAAATRCTIVRHLPGGRFVGIDPPPPPAPRINRRCRYCGRESLRADGVTGWRCDRCGTRA